MTEEDPLSIYSTETVGEPTKVKVQHYMPQLYLRQFASTDGRVVVTNVDTGRRFASGTPVIGAERHFYDFEEDGQKLSSESWLERLETAVAPIVRSLSDDPDVLLMLPDAEEVTLARFLTSFRFRTYHYREMILKLKREFEPRAKEIVRGAAFEFLPPNSAQAYWEALRDDPSEWWMEDERTGSLAQWTARALGRLPGFANLLRSMPWRIGLVPPERPLYAVDSGLGIYTSVVRPKWDRGGFVFLRYYFPLSPRVLLQVNPWDWRKGPPQSAVGTRQRRDFSLWEAEFAAKVLTSSAYRDAYGGARIVGREDARAWLAKYDSETGAWARQNVDARPAYQAQEPFTRRMVEIRLGSTEAAQRPLDGF
jgi:hypothetical protein